MALAQSHGTPNEPRLVLYGAGDDRKSAAEHFAVSTGGRTLKRKIERYPNGEIGLELENVRDTPLTYFAPSTGNAYDDIMETLLTLETLWQNGVGRICIVLPDTMIRFKGQYDVDLPIFPSFFGDLVNGIFGNRLNVTLVDSDHYPVEFVPMRPVRAALEKGQETVIVHGAEAKDAAHKISAELHLPVLDWHMGLSAFRGGTLSVKGDFLGKNVVIVGSTAGNPNKAVLETAMMTYVMRRLGAAHITVAQPLWHYSRADRSDNKRVPVSSKLVARVYDLYHPNRILAQDLHDPRIASFTEKTPVDASYTTALFASNIAHIVEKVGIDPKKIVIAAVDSGARTRARQLMRHLRENHGLDVVTSIPTVDKIRTGAGVSKAEGILAADEFKERLVILVDDMTDSGKTLDDAATDAKALGASMVWSYVTFLVSTPDKATGQPRLLGTLQATEKAAAIDLFHYTNAKPNQLPAIEALPQVVMLDNDHWVAANLREVLGLNDNGEQPSVKTLNDTARVPPQPIRDETVRMIAAKAQAAGLLKAEK